MGRRGAWVVLLFALACAGGDAAHPVLRVGTSGDYAPFSFVDAAGRRDGFDVALARAFARAHGLRIRWVPVAWTTLGEEFAAGRFDLVASGVTVRPERSLAGRFTVPTARSGAIALVRGAVELERPGVRIAVNRGGHLERVAQLLFPTAQLLVLTPNAAVREALLSGRADAALTDTLEAPRWLAGSEGITTQGPFTRDWKAWWLPAGAEERAREVDAWLLAREADGELAALRARYLGAGVEPAATPLAALTAAVAERLALMPLVAEAKRAGGTPVQVPAQEERVLEAALAATRAAAERSALPVPDDRATRAFFVALIAAARGVQEHSLAGAPPGGTPPPLDAALRPALARISERIAWLLVRLPPGLDADRTASAFAALDVAGLDTSARQELAAALLDLARAPRTPPDT